MNAFRNSPSSGESVSDGSRGEQLWKCRYCGNVLIRRERPTECYHCRRGENDYGETRLFAPITVSDLAEVD